MRRRHGSIGSLGKLPHEARVKHFWKTWKNPFDDVWPGVEEKLKINPGLEAKTRFEDLQRRYPGRFGDWQLRTLQHRAKVWRALQRPHREVFFPQVHKPGELCYERGSLMITSNLPSQMGAYLQGSHDEAAAIDRLVHSIILELNLPSYRLEYSTAHKEVQKEVES